MTALSLVTGGCGFVGRHLVDALVSRGDRVRVMDVAPAAHRPDVEYVRCDVTSAADVTRALEGVTTVFHNASRVHTKRNRIEDLVATNVGGTKIVVAACRTQRVPKLVYVSSGSVVYEGRDIVNGDESLPYNTGRELTYSVTKRDAEIYVLGQNDASLSTVALRPHVIFGPGDGRFLPALLAHAHAGRLRFRVGRKDWLSDYTYVSNLADALLLADTALSPTSPLAGRPYFITNGEPMPFWDFVSRVLARLNLPPIRYALPHQLVYAVAAVKETVDSLRGAALYDEDGLTRFAIRYMCTHHYFSIARAQRDFGYVPKVSVAEGIERTCRAIAEAPKSGLAA